MTKSLSTTPEKKTGKRRRRFRIIVVLVVILALAAVCCLRFEQLRSQQVARETTRVGSSVVLNTAEWNLRCTGKGSATIILEAGLGESALTWADVQEKLSSTARVCSYDRPGYGWSAPTSAPRDAMTQAEELRTLLIAAGEQGPYLLVGHSLGSFVARLFACVYPNEVNGLVLLDPTTTQSVSATGAPVVPLVAMRGQAIISRLGLATPFISQQVRNNAAAEPPAELMARAQFLYNAQAIETAMGELASSQTSADEVDHCRLPSATPVEVLLSDEGWANDRTSLSQLSDATELIHMAGGHYVHYEHASEVADRVETLLASTVSR